MITLRTAEEVGAFLATPLGQDTEPIIRPHLERLADYEFEQIAAIAVGEKGETPAALGLDPDLYEYCEVHSGWTEQVFIVSDDGFGWIVLIRS